MASIFDELLALDNPYVAFIVAFGATTREFLARRLKANELDALEAFFSDEYARLVIEKTQPCEGKQSELDRVLLTYRLRPRHDLLKQILGTRYVEVQQRGAQIAGIDLQQAQQHAATLTDDTEKAAYAAEIEASLKIGIEQAQAEFSAEYDSRSDDELAQIMAQVNVNMKAMSEARLAQDAHRLHYMVYTSEHERVFPTRESVLELQADTITRFKKAIDSALLAQADLPFVLQGGPERAGQPSSAKPSAPETIPSSPGSTRTKRRRKN